MNMTRKNYSRPNIFKPTTQPNKRLKQFQTDRSSKIKNIRLKIEEN